jgi:hypothetical protein
MPICHPLLVTALCLSVILSWLLSSCPSVRLSGLIIRYYEAVINKFLFTFSFSCLHAAAAELAPSSASCAFHVAGVLILADILAAALQLTPAVSGALASLYAVAAVIIAFTAVVPLLSSSYCICSCATTDDSLSTSLSVKLSAVGQLPRLHSFCSCFTILQISSYYLLSFLQLFFYLSVQFFNSPAIIYPAFCSCLMPIYTFFATLQLLSIQLSAVVCCLPTQFFATP